MPKEQMRPDRQTTRLRGFDYRTAGYYSVTICTHDLLHEFGHIERATMILNEAGHLAQTELQKLPERFPSVSLDQFVIMPNHVHCIILIAAATNVANSPARFQAHMQTLLEVRIPTLKEPYQPPKPGEIIRSYKAATTRSIRSASQPYFAWQASYYNTIITDDSALYRLRCYIQANPANWNKNTLYTSPNKLSYGHTGLLLGEALDPSVCPHHLHTDYLAPPPQLPVCPCLLPVSRRGNSLPVKP